MSYPKLKCVNLKLTFYSTRDKNTSLQIPHNLTQYVKNNFFIIKFKKLTFTIYAKNARIMNVVGFRFKHDMQKINQFFKIVGFNWFKMTICNSVFVTKVDMTGTQLTLNLEKKLGKTGLLKTHTISRNSEIFPAVFLKCKKKYKTVFHGMGGYPTLLIFKSGKIVLLGGKTIQAILKCVSLMSIAVDDVPADHDDVCRVLSL